jgi:hypothetical protein
MSVAQSRILTEHFYAWERVGRGWHVAERPADLEPPFVPFFGHFVAGDIIDDGRVPHWWERLTGRKTLPPPTAIKREEEPIMAYADENAEDITIYRVNFPRHFKPGAERMEQLLVMLSYRKSPVSFEIIASDDTVTLQWATRDSDAAFFHAQVSAFFPECGMVQTYDDMIETVLREASCAYAVDFGLAEEFMRPIATYAKAEHDPYTPLFGILERLACDEAAIVQVMFSGTHNAWAESMVASVTDDSGRQSFFADAPEMPQLAKEKVSRPLYGATIRAMTASDTMDGAAMLLEHVATAITHISTSPANSLVPLGGEDYTANMRLSDMLMRRSHRVGMLLNSRELATLAHFPPPGLSRKLLGQNRATKAAPAPLVDAPYCLGVNGHQGAYEYVGIDTQQRLRHLHLIGATGTGKSTLLHALVMQDVESGGGCCLIDPHGDLCEAVLSAIPEHRVTDVVLIDPSDVAYPVGLNILLAHSDLERELLASDLVALFRRFSTSWGDQMNSVFANAISAFVYNTSIGTLGDLRRFLIEPSFRNRILATCTDPDIAYYWQKEYPILKSSSVGSILTRLDSFLRPKSIRNMVCQQRSLNFQELMDTNKIVLVKLSQGLLGEENSYLLGAFIVSKLQQTAMARQAQAAHARVPFYCYIDEFQHFVTPSMASILSGGRKFGLGLVLAHQDMQQVSSIDANIASSLMANAGTRICFRLGDTDARRMQEGFSAFGSEDLQNLGIGEAIVRVNNPEHDFNISVIPYTADGPSCKERIITHSRNAYSVPVIPPTEREPEPSSKAAPRQYTPPSNPMPIIIEPEIPAPEPRELREHRYLQAFVKKLAEEHGYKATIEMPTLDGTGFVDVLLEKDGKHIAMEISVTTSATWELHNIQKCLAAGHTNIVVCVTTNLKITQIQKHIQKWLNSAEQSCVRVISPDDIPTLFSEAGPPKDTVTTYKGYRVKVQYGQPGDDTQRDIIQRILRSKKP